MFHKSAEVYDAIYRAQEKDYRSESATVASLISSRAPEARTLLDVGCSSGGHIGYLREWFTCSGLDISEELLDVARAQFGDEIQFHAGDMADFDLGQKFDAIVCLFSSIGYVCSYERLAATARCFANHLAPGGVIVVEPWITPEDWEDETRGYITVVEEENTQAVRMMLRHRDGRINNLDLQYLVLNGDKIEHYVEHHQLGLFSFDEYRSAFEAAGFTVEIDNDGLIGRGLVIGQLPW
jgi:SAM-dependent methyltransferase